MPLSPFDVRISVLIATRKGGRVAEAVGRVGEGAALLSRHRQSEEEAGVALVMAS